MKDDFEIIKYKFDKEIKIIPIFDLHYGSIGCNLKEWKEFVDYMMYQQEEAYFTQNHYIMDGRTKRRVRKMIERNYDKGRYGSLYSGKSLND